MSESQTLAVRQKQPLCDLCRLQGWWKRCSRPGTLPQSGNDSMSGRSCENVV